MNGNECPHLGSIIQVNTTRQMPLPHRSDSISAQWSASQEACHCVESVPTRRLSSVLDYVKHRLLNLFVSDAGKILQGEDLNLC